LWRQRFFPALLCLKVLWIWHYSVAGRDLLDGVAEKVFRRAGCAPFRPDHNRDGRLRREYEMPVRKTSKIKTGPLKA
jgi:hypothetical protein